MKSYDYFAVIYDGAVWCLDTCFRGVGADESDDEVMPIFADSEWDTYPVCHACGREHDYVQLTPDGQRQLARREYVDAMVAAYLETALWSSTDNSNESGGLPCDETFEVADFDADSRGMARRDCADFYDEMSALLEAAKIDAWDAGHNFWLNRNRHGAGFWDLGLGEIGDKLSDASKAHGSCDVECDLDNMEVWLS